MSTGTGEIMLIIATAAMAFYLFQQKNQLTLKKNKNKNNKLLISSNIFENRVKQDIRKNLFCSGGVEGVTTSIVIPVYPPDFKYLQGLIHHLFHEQTICPDEVIIAASEVPNELEFRKLVLQQESKQNIIFDCVPFKQLAGANRNRGMQRSTGEIIMFLDADDFYHAQKIEITKYLFETTNNLDLLLHNYKVIHHNNKKKNNWDWEREITFSMLENCTKKYKKVMYDNTFPRNGENGTTNINGTGFSLTHGVIAISKNVKEKGFRYNETASLGEDGRFCQEILFDTSTGNVLAIDLKLMGYHCL